MSIAGLPDQIIDKIGLMSAIVEPLTRFEFAVEIDGVLGPGSPFVAGFRRIRGLGDSVQVREVEEGGYPGVHRYPRRSNLNQISLERGMGFDRSLWNWYQEVATWEKGKPSYRRTMSIYNLKNFDTTLPSVQIWRFDVYGAYPISWESDDYDAHEQQFNFETITIVHKGISEAKGIFSGEIIGRIANILS